VPVKKVKADTTGTMRCPKCGSTQFVGKKTVKGKLAGGFIFAPQRLKCVACGTTLKSG
jgi:transposase-like protein